MSARGCGRAGAIGTVRPLSSLVAEVERSPRRYATRLVGIDGRGGSGKSTLARRLRDLSPTAIAVVQMDDFYRPAADRRSPAPREIGADFDWRRLRDEVLLPLRRNEPARYQRYDWPSDRLADWHEVSAGGTLLVEGNYVLRAELRRMYDVAIWVECPFEERLARGIDRDGGASRAAWLGYWMPEEDRYVAEHRPESFADIVIDGRSARGVDSRQQVVVLRSLRRMPADGRMRHDGGA